MRKLPIIIAGVMIISTAAFAEPGKTEDGNPAARTTGTETTDIGVRTTTTGTDLTDIGVRSTTGDDKVVRKRPGRTTYSSDGEGSGATTSTERKKMEKLPAAEAEPLELMDETDPCPTLPC
jgi:hypothetical protein